MKKSVFLLVGFSILFFACQNDPANRESEPGVDPVEVNLDQIQDSEIHLDCQDITQEADKNKHHAVFLVIGQNKVKVGDVETCNVLDSTLFSQLHIPDEAIHAVGDAERPGSPLMYVIRTGYDRLVVRRGTTGDTTFRAIATFTTNELSENPAINKTELVGTYAWQGKDRSRIIFLGLSSRELSAQMFRINGPLPPFEQLTQALTQSMPEVLQGFRVNLLNLEFECDLGRGNFEQKDDTWYLHFWEEKDDDGNPLSLKKIQ